jgi:hypothetical protein
MAVDLGPVIAAAVVRAHLVAKLSLVVTDRRPGHFEHFGNLRYKEAFLE